MAAVFGSMSVRTVNANARDGLACESMASVSRIVGATLPLSGVSALRIACGVPAKRVR